MILLAGATESGKTHTVFGENGLVEGAFQIIRESARDGVKVVGVSAVEMKEKMGFLIPWRMISYGLNLGFVLASYLDVIHFITHEVGSRHHTKDNQETDDGNSE